MQSFERNRPSVLLPLCELHFLTKQVELGQQRTCFIFALCCAINRHLVECTPTLWITDSEGNETSRCVQSNLDRANKSTCSSALNSSLSLFDLP